jgi:hypothetical protein
MYCLYCKAPIRKFTKSKDFNHRNLHKTCFLKINEDINLHRKMKNNLIEFNDNDENTKKLCIELDKQIESLYLYLQRTIKNI